jgi:hypothetical protein
MSKFTVTIETPKIHLGGFFSEFWRILAVKKAPVEEKIKDLLLSYAQDTHKYQHQTRQLRSATKTDGSFGLGKEIRLYVDTTQADYAKYVIEPQYFDDPFIDASFNYNKPKIDQLVRDLYIDAVNTFNALQ